MIRYFRQKIEFLIFMVLLQNAMPGSAQVHPGKDFTQIDANIQIYPKKQLINPQLLVSELVTGLSDTTEQVRAIYAWIAKNISYDLASYRFSGNKVHPTEEILKTRKAVCSGYSALFKQLCEIAGIKAVVIEGYAKGYDYTPYTKILSTNHAWNAVFLGGEWHFVDVTWAAGLPEEITGKHKVIDLDDYFFIPFEKLIKTHLPEDPIWQLQDKKISLADFESGITESNDTDAIVSQPVATVRDEFDEDILRYKRSLNFNPRNEGLRMQLSFAYVYKAISITDVLWKFRYIELLDTLNPIEKDFLAYLDSAQNTIGISLSIKDKTIIEDESNYQKGVFYYELAANIFGKADKTQGVLPEDRSLIEELFSKAEEHFKNVLTDSIYYPDAQKYLGNIADYRMKKKG